VSGNPTGRPRYSFSGPPEDTILSRIISWKVTITVDDRPRRVPIKEAVLLQLVDKAAKGHFGSMKEIMAVAAADEMGREMSPEFDEEFGILLKRLWSLSDLEEALGHAGLLLSDADHNLYFKREVFEAASAGQSPRHSWPELRLTTLKSKLQGPGRIASPCSKCFPGRWNAFCSVHDWQRPRMLELLDFVTVPPKGIVPPCEDSP